MKLSFRAICLFSPLALIVGCGCGSSKVSYGVDEVKRLAPTTKLPAEGMLELPGASIPVNIESTMKGTSFVVELSAFGEVLESESYKVSENQFALESALGEVYEPIAPLLGEGTLPEGSWKWKGMISIPGGLKRKATAEIFGKSGPIDVVGFKGPGRMVQMNLSIESGESVKAERILSFHFGEGKGLVKRDFGQASIRTLAKPESSGE